MKKNIFLNISFLIIALTMYSQKYSISGYIENKSNGEKLLGATVYVKELKTGTSTNLYGFYSLTIEKGTYTIVYNYIGFKSFEKTITLEKDQTINIELEEKTLELEEIVITSDKKNENIKEVQMSVDKLSIKTIKKMPQFLGEVDVIRSIQMLPGVTTVGEGASGFNVRGGNIDENLILLDEGKVYNSSHLFGFFSVFNSDAIKDVKLYKGGIPARYGGRLSSVLDVRQKDGNKKELTAKGGIGTVSSRLSIEGPIKKNKSSFLVSGRRTYFDLPFPLIKELKNTRAYFYDFNIKVNYEIDKNNSFFLSSYLGRDVFRFGKDFGFDWGNKTGTLRWNHLYNNKLFSNLSIIYSDYNYKLTAKQENQGVDWVSRINNYDFKLDYNYYLNTNNTIEFGISSIYYKFRPGVVKSTIFNFKANDEYALESGMYLSNKQTINTRLNIEYGVRYSHFLNMGGLRTGTKYNVYRYSRPTSEDDIVATVNVNKRQITQEYGAIEPRFGLSFQLNETSSIKMSYNRMNQYLHLISNTFSATPIDIWKVSGKYIKPTIADQVAIGYFNNFIVFDKQFELTAEVYYKKLQNVLEYKDNAELILNNNIETELLFGKGRVKGLELQVKKKEGRITGWISYTLSRSERLVESKEIENQIVIKGINNNDWYPTNWNKTHDITFVGIYEINKKWDISAIFTYYTGRPSTFPESKFVYEGKIIPYYSGRNQHKLPNYHRLDFSATYRPAKNENRRFKTEFVFSLYNVYARRNAYSISFRQRETSDGVTIVGDLDTEAVRLAILGSVFPSVTYNFNF